MTNSDLKHLSVTQMAPPNYTDNWQRYWARSYESGRRAQLAYAAAAPLDGWLTADVPTLVEDEVGIDPEHLREFPDTLLEHGREGFRKFALARDAVDGTDDREAYGLVPIHLAGASQVRGLDFEFDNPVTETNTVRVFRNASVSDEPTRQLRPSVVTFRCPLGHETRLRQPLFRRWTVDTCGEPDCSNEVTLVDSRTRVRRTARFSVTHDGTTYPCVATGRYAGDTADAADLTGSARLELTGIPRLLVDPDGDVRQTIEVLHAEPV